MSLRRDLLRLVYPIYRLFASFTAKGAIIVNSKHLVPPESFYELGTRLNDGRNLRFEGLRGKKVLIVNTASDCVYTGQYAELEQLYREMRGELEIIGFPSNDFNEQEKGSDEEIAVFCSTNYHISFPLALKSRVIGPQRNPVFTWLSDSTKNGWNDQKPVWNFSKYLVDGQGRLTQYFGPAVPAATIKKLASGVQ